MPRHARQIDFDGDRLVADQRPKLLRISTRDTTLDIATTTVVEVNGNPVEISAVVVYRVEDTYRAALHVENDKQFIEDQAGYSGARAPPVLQVQAGRGAHGRT